MRGGFWDSKATKRVKKLLKRTGLNKKYSASDFSGVSDFKHTYKRLKTEHGRRKKDKEKEEELKGEELNEMLIMEMRQLGLGSAGQYPPVEETFEPVEAALASLSQKIDHLNQLDENSATLKDVQPQINQIKGMLRSLAGNKDQTRVTGHLTHLTEIETSLKANQTTREEVIRSLRADLQRLIGEWAVCPTKTDNTSVQALYRTSVASTDLLTLKAGVETLRSHVYYCSSPEAQREQLLKFLSDSRNKLILPTDCKGFEHEKYGYRGETITTEMNKIDKLIQGVMDGTIQTMQEIQPAVTSAMATRDAILKYCRDYNSNKLLAVMMNYLPYKYTVQTGVGLGLGAAASGFAIASAIPAITAGVTGAGSLAGIGYGLNVLSNQYNAGIENAKLGVNLATDPVLRTQYMENAAAATIAAAKVAADKAEADKAAAATAAAAAATAVAKKGGRGRRTQRI